MARFSKVGNAISYQNRAIKPMIIIMGDDGLFWVVSMRDGEKLISQGYEVAK